MSTIAAHQALAPRRSPTSPLTGFWRIAWKEYRTIRPFWAMLAGLTVLAQCITVAVVEDQSTVVEVLFFRLAMPVLFAVGAAGTAFAGEREEGTIEFLRAAPISVGQVFVAKLLAVAIGAVLMFGVVIVSAILCTRGHIAEHAEWNGLWSVWVVSVIEAIAWGTLFSLLGSRPIIAVILTLVAVSTCDHALAWASKGPASHFFELESYVRAAKWRLLAALLVFVLDVLLSRQWLGSISGAERRGRALRQDIRTQGTAELPSIATEDEAQLSILAGKRDRGAMLGRLLWQQWRQSWRMMLLVLILFPVVSVLVVPLPFAAAIMGSLVFLPDQEQRRYRFFTEHDASPRMVWLARQLPWLAILAVATLVMAAHWHFYPGWTSSLWRYVNKDLDVWRDRHVRISDEPQLGLAFAIMLVSYAGGQWVSLFIRSGILAAFSAAVLGGLLFGWALLMHVMHVNPIWTLLPIAVAFFWATWLRAPDWISENRRWSARAKATAAVIVPAAVLIAAVAIFRVHQVSDVSPGFDVAGYERELQANFAEGQATAELYREAASRFKKRAAIAPTSPSLAGEPTIEAGTSVASTATAKNAQTPRPDVPTIVDSAPPEAFEQRENARPPTQDDLRWLARHANTLPLLLEAAKRSVCLFEDPRTQHRWLFFPDGDEFSELLLASARQMEGDGDFDGALDRYFATFNVISQTDVYQEDDFWRVFQQIQYWGAQKGQSSDRIRRAIKRVEALDSRFLNLDDMVASSYILGRRIAEGESTAIWLYARGDWHANPLWTELMPWEKQRAVRILNLLTAVAEHRLQEMRRTLDLDDQQINEPNGRGLAQYSSSPSVEGGYFATKPWTGRPDDDPRRREEDWLHTTAPDMIAMGEVGGRVAKFLARFEAQRRATMIVLAIEAYRLDRGALPKSLSELVPNYLAKVPFDPYSGFEFKYSPEGITPPRDVVEQHELDRVGGYSLEFNRPGIWSTGPYLTPQIEVKKETDKGGDTVDHSPFIIVGYQHRGDGNGSSAILPSYTAWGFGDWFGIPDVGIGSHGPADDSISTGSSNHKEVAP